LSCLVEMEAKIEFEESDHLSSSSGITKISIAHNLTIYIALKENIAKLKTELDHVVEDSNLYERVRNGFHVLIFGAPNSGKSSLMNYLGKFNILRLS
jgi:tRNA U34 5-carboxymethylaminomethyl modifying GTPase MnmE/TrmE